MAEERPWCLWSFFEQTCSAAAADAPALVDRGRAVSFSALREQAEALDRLMRHRGVRKGSPVMLVSECNTFALVAALAIIRIGAVFIPGDRAVPPAKRAEFIALARVTHLLCEHPLDGLESVAVLCAEDGVCAPDGAAELAPAASWVASELAAIFFSSGSTGTPKGVKHSATFWFELIGNHHFDGASNLDSPRDPVTWSDGFWHGSVTWYSNWAVISEVFSGKKTIAISKDVLLDALELQKLRIEHGCTQIYFPPAHLRTILSTEPGALSDLEFIYVWGEKMNADMVDETGRQYPMLDLFDWLGTSETMLGIHRRFRASDGVQAAHWQADRDTTMVIVDPDDHTKLVTELYVPGEMCFSRPPGATISMGYVGNDAWTKEKFVPNPFGEGTLFRIGDIAQWIEEPEGLPARVRQERGLDRPIESMPEAMLPEHASCCRVGTARAILEVLGRNDDQIKVRGQMVNLVEVDTKATAISFVSAAGCKSVVTPSGDTQIALFCEMEEPSRLDDVRGELMQVMENFAVPTFIYTIDSLPRNPNGKLVRRELPTPAFEAPEAAPHALPDDPSAQAQIVAIMRRLLNAGISLDDNFLMAGGHSLLAVKVITEIRTNPHLGGVRLTVPELYAHAGLRDLIALVEERQAAGAPAPALSIQPRGAHASIPVPATAFNASCMVRGPPAIQSYQTVSMAVWIEGLLDSERLRRCLQLVHDRHEVLRLRYSMEGGRRCLVATPPDAYPLPLREIDFSDRPAAEAKKAANELYAHDACWQPFDPFGADRESCEARCFGPLTHFFLVKTAEQEFFFFYGMHHAIADGYSDTVFWREINAAYLAFSQGVEPSLPALSVQYADFALWQIEVLYQEEKVRQGFEKVAQLYMAPGVGWARAPDHGDVPCESVVRHALWYRGGPWTETSFPFEICDSLRSIAQANGATLFMAVVAAFHMWQYEQTQQAELGLGVTLYGRHHNQLEHLIGNFQHQSCVRTNVAGCTNFLDVLARVKRSFLEMMQLADCACFDHASWADILEGCAMDEMPAEVRDFLVGRPKCHLNFEEFDYGAASTEGFNAAGLTAKNQVAPVSTGEEADGDGPTAATDPDHHGACAPYYYPSCVDGRIPAGEKFAGDFGPRAGSDLCPIRDIDDYEVYFSFAMSSRTAEDIAGYDEDYIYMAFDDRLYEKETARAMLGSFVSRLKQCAQQPAATVALPPELEGPTDGEVDEMGRRRLGAEATAFISSQLTKWQARCKEHAAAYRQAEGG